jgi:hypothetical protein
MPPLLVRYRDVPIQASQRTSITIIVAPACHLLAQPKSSMIPISVIAKVYRGVAEAHSKGGRSRLYSGRLHDRQQSIAFFL